jgi:hypothetical protein
MSLVTIGGFTDGVGFSIVSVEEEQLNKANERLRSVKKVMFFNILIIF